MNDLINAPLTSTVLAFASVGRMVEVYPQQRFPQYVLMTIWFLVICGLFFVARELISFALQIASLVRAG
jgi:hypothetical protein